MSAEARVRWEAGGLKEEEAETRIQDQLHRRKSVPVPQVVDTTLVP